ncbi:DUF2515 family protein [Bacillus sp. KH172YL63]|uniref:DUF2515 family protein n=1 Tax=Bacillus sp. KH172YL63 TaxID=2709784 RepID=UPI0013E4778E|nr:DUF2515 family protein [Bacillus sp. KH172YL63]BCB04492.1 hypothetical protein KH172YL63_26250 [Bacillus sp. KH172YL63]
MKKFNNTYRFLPYIPEPKRTGEWIGEVTSLVNSFNQDNISRTMAYQNFYLLHPDIKWSFLAAMVSRNAGWNMTDLKSDVFLRLLGPRTRDVLFMTYERANWSIFQDAFAQLLLYHYSTIYGRKMFHLCRDFRISRFMEEEWNHYWDYRDGDRLVQSLIINEQHIIQQPVIEHEVYKGRVFGTSLFFIEDHLHFSSVLFPTLQGELFGSSVHGFRKVDNRILLGNLLYKVLFDPRYHPSFTEFALEVEHTGSRTDYEMYCEAAPGTNTPKLREVYEVIPHHWQERTDWWREGGVNPGWYREPARLPEIVLTEWFLHKQSQLRLVAKVKGAVGRIFPWG